MIGADAHKIHLWDMDEADLAVLRIRKDKRIGRIIDEAYSYFASKAAFSREIVRVGKELYGESYSLERNYTIYLDKIDNIGFMELKIILRILEEKGIHYSLKDIEKDITICIKVAWNWHRIRFPIDLRKYENFRAFMILMAYLATWGIIGKSQKKIYFLSPSKEEKQIFNKELKSLFGKVYCSVDKTYTEECTYLDVKANKQVKFRKKHTSLFYDSLYGKYIMHYLGKSGISAILHNDENKRIPFFNVYVKDIAKNIEKTFSRDKALEISKTILRIVFLKLGRGTGVSCLNPSIFSYSPKSLPLLRQVRLLLLYCGFAETAELDGRYRKELIYIKQSVNKKYYTLYISGYPNILRLENGDFNRSNRVAFAVKQSRLAYESMINLRLALLRALASTKPGLCLTSADIFRKIKSLASGEDSVCKEAHLTIIRNYGLDIRKISKILGFTHLMVLMQNGLIQRNVAKRNVLYCANEKCRSFVKRGGSLKDYWILGSLRGQSHSKRVTHQKSIVLMTAEAFVLEELRDGELALADLHWRVQKAGFKMIYRQFNLGVVTPLEKKGAIVSWRGPITSSGAAKKYVALAPA